MAKPQVITDEAGARQLILRHIAAQKRRWSLPVLDDKGQVTGEMYDVRFGRPEQPDPNRFRAHLDYLNKKYAGGYRPAVGQRIEGFNPVDPYESEGFGDSLKNMLQSAYVNSLSGMVEQGLGKLGIGDEIPDLFGAIDMDRLEAWQPNTFEQIGAGIGSFFMPADLAALALGGGIGGAAAKGATLGRVATGVTRTAVQLGTYEGARGFFEGAFDPEKQSLDEFAVGFGKGAFLGATLGVAGEIAGKLIPRKLAGITAIREANRAGAEIFTLGTVSPLLEGETPGLDDYVNAAGFIVGIKTLGALGELPKRTFNRRRAAEQMQIEEAVKEGRSFEEVVPELVEKAIEGNSGLSNKFVRRLKAAPDGNEVGKIGDFIVGENVRKLFTPEVLEMPVKVSSKVPPERAAEVAEGEVAGWVGWDAADGAYKIFVHPQHRNRAAGFTLLHEAGHLMRRARGRDIGTELAEKTADEMAKYVSEVKELTPQQVEALAKKQWERRLQEPIVREIMPAVPGVRKTLKELLPDTKIRPKSYVFLTEKAAKSAQNALKLFGKGRQGVSIGVYETAPGKGTWTILDISAPTKADRLALLKKAQAQAQQEGVTLYVSSKLNKTEVFREAVKQKIISEKPVGKYHQVKGAEVAVEAPVKPERAATTPEPTVATEPKAGPYEVSIPRKRPIPEGKPEVPVEGDRAVDQVTRQRLRAKRRELRELYKQSGRQVSEEYIQNLSVDQMNYILTGGREGIAPKADAFRLISRYTERQAEGFSKEAGERIKEFSRRIIPDFVKQLKNRFQTREGQELVRDNGPLSIDTVYKRQHRRAGSFMERMRQGGFVQRSKTEAWLTGKPSLTENEGHQIAAAMDRLPGEATVVTPRMQQVAGHIGRVLDQFHAELAPIWHAAGLKLGYVKNYFPRILQREIRESMYNDLREIENMLSTAESKSDAAVRRAIERKSKTLNEAIDHIVKSGQAKDLYSALKMLNRSVVYEMFPSARFEKPRTLDLPSKFYERDARVVLPEYVMAMSKRAAELETWGNHGQKALELLAKIREQNYDEYLTANKMLRIFTGEFNVEHGLRGRTRQIADAFIAAEFATKIGLGRATLLNLTQPIISFGQELGIWNAVRGGLDLFNPEIRSYLRESGAVDRYLYEAILGQRPSGMMGKIADKMGTLSGFAGVNKMLQYWSGATFYRAARGWHRAAQGTGAYGRWARQRLLDFNIDPNRPLEIQQNTMLESIYRFATDSQLQANMLRDPLMMNDPRLRPLFVFKRFGVRQMTYLKDTMTRELGRGNVMPLLRLGAAGVLGGEATIWTINKIKAMLSGEPAYRQDDEWQDRMLNNLAFIGSLGMMSDFLDIESVAKVPGALKFAVEPVVAADAYRLIDASTAFLSDWEKYGDGWLATRRNAHNLFGFFGSYPRSLGYRMQTESQVENRRNREKGEQKRQVFEALLSGDWQAASRRVQNWNGAYPEDALTVSDVGPGALRKWIRQQSKLYAEARGGDKKQMRQIERERRRELTAELSKRESALNRYREAL